MLEQFLLGWFQRYASQNQQHGVIFYRWPFKAAMIIGASFFFVLVGIGLGNGVEFALVVGLVVFCIINLAGVLEAFWVWIKYDDHYIYTHSPWRTNRMISWDDLVEVNYSHMAQWYVIKTKNSGKIRLPLLLSGVGYFLKQLETRGLDLPPVQNPNL